MNVRACIYPPLYMNVRACIYPPLKKGGKGGFEVKQRAAPMFAQHTKTMSIIDQQPCIMPLAQRQQFRQLREIAIHAVHRIGDDDLAPASRLLQQQRELAISAWR